MPYIIQSKRDMLDFSIKQMLNVLRELESDDATNNFEGNFNYVITKLIIGSYGESYRDINDVMGMLECVKHEYYRRVAAPYEDQKRFSNGDVYEQEISMNNMITEISPTKFVVKVNGVVVSRPQATRQLAEATILTLPTDQQSLAEIVPVTMDGKELLLG